MSTLSFRDKPIHTVGVLPKVGSLAPKIHLRQPAPLDFESKSLEGKVKVLNIFPSIDTPTCQTSVRKFNERVSKLDNTVVLCISNDLPFAQSRFCAAEGLKNVMTASALKTSFGRDYGVEFVDGALVGLLSRAVVVLGPKNQVLYTEQVTDVSAEPNYDNALKALQHSSALVGGNECALVGSLPKVGDTAPDCTLVNFTLAEVSLRHYEGKRKVLNIFPSVDTPTCATSVRKFNEQASKLDNTVVLCVSVDLPFALDRFCAAEGLTNVVTLSGFRSTFGVDYGIEFAEGPIQGYYARSVVVLDEANKVLHTELVHDTSKEPNYKAALDALAQVAK